MNNTDKATMDAARRMLRGKLDVEEVSMMLGIPVEKLTPIKEEIEEEVRKVFGNVDSLDQAGGQVLFDLFDDDGSNDALDLGEAVDTQE